MGSWAALYVAGRQPARQGPDPVRPVPERWPSGRRPARRRACTRPVLDAAAAAGITVVRTYGSSETSGGCVSTAFR